MEKFKKIDFFERKQLPIWKCLLLYALIIALFIGFILLGGALSFNPIVVFLILLLGFLAIEIMPIIPSTDQEWVVMLIFKGVRLLYLTSSMCALAYAVEDGNDLFIRLCTVAILAIIFETLGLIAYFLKRVKNRIDQRSKERGEKLILEIGEQEFQKIEERKSNRWGYIVLIVVIVLIIVVIGIGIANM